MNVWLGTGKDQIFMNFCLTYYLIKLQLYYSFGWMKFRGLNIKILKIVQLMPDYLPLNKIKVEVSSVDSNKWIHITKPEKPSIHESDEVGGNIDRDIEMDPFPLFENKKRAINRSFFGLCKVPLEMDERVIESGLKVLECKQKTMSDMDSEKEKAYHNEIKEELKRLKGLEGKIDEIHQKTDQIERQLDKLISKMPCYSSP
jgi:hypothetical protein